MLSTKRKLNEQFLWNSFPNTGFWVFISKHYLLWKPTYQRQLFNKYRSKCLKLSLQGRSKYCLDPLFELKKLLFLRKHPFDPKKARWLYSTKIIPRWPYIERVYWIFMKWIFGNSAPLLKKLKNQVLCVLNQLYLNANTLANPFPGSSHL